MAGSEKRHSCVVEAEIGSIDRNFVQVVNNLMVVPTVPSKGAEKHIDIQNYPHLCDISLSPVPVGAQVDLLIGQNNPNITEALKGHRVVWKIEIYYLIRMTYEWKSMSSGWHNNIVVTHPDEIPISAKSSGWHMVVWYVIRMTYCSVQKSSGWDTARS